MSPVEAGVPEVLGKCATRFKGGLFFDVLPTAVLKVTSVISSRYEDDRAETPKTKVSAPEHQLVQDWLVPVELGSGAVQVPLVVATPLFVCPSDGVVLELFTVFVPFPPLASFQ